MRYMQLFMQLLLVGGSGDIMRFTSQRQMLACYIQRQCLLHILCSCFQRSRLCREVYVGGIYMQLFMQLLSVGGHSNFMR